MRQRYKGEDIRGRLGSTVLRYKGLPYYCEVEGTTLLLYSMEGGGLTHRVDAEDPQIDVSSLTLGYINVDQVEYKFAIYLKREAHRQFKQGVSLSALTQTVLKKGVSTIHWKHLQSKGLVDCVLGRYPSLDNGLSMMTKKGYSSVALSRNVALMRDADILKVYVKTDEVGYMKLGTKRVILPKNEMSFVNKLILEEISGWDISESFS